MGDLCSAAGKNGDNDDDDDDTSSATAAKKNAIAMANAEAPPNTLLSPVPLSHATQERRT
jgi:cyclophilin family peptidyl-prolyl cis-trans isomerase